MNQSLPIAALVSLFSCATIAVGQIAPPPGPVVPTMKPLDAVEPRVCVNELPGDGKSVHLITEPGVYVLTEDITGEPGKSGIAITTAGPVTIDLNGFNITGVPGSLHGIEMDLGAVGVVGSQLSVISLEASAGSLISRWGGSGIRTSGVTQCACTHLAAENNGGDGLEHLHAESVVHRDIASRFNGGSGTTITPNPQARGRAGVTNRFLNCRARGNTGSGFDITARADSYAIEFDDTLSCANGGNGVLITEDASIPGPGGRGPGTVKCWDGTCRDNDLAGISLNLPTGSQTVLTANRVTCAGNGGNGLEIDSPSTGTPHYGAACSIESSQFTGNGANGLRTMNPVHVASSTMGENALYGVSGSGPDSETCILQVNVCHLISNGGGGGFCSPGRFQNLRSTFTDNGGPGIELDNGCLLLSDSNVTNNNGPGVLVNGTLNVTSSAFRRNTGAGVDVSNGEVVAHDMVCEFNGDAVNNAGGMRFFNCPSVSLMRCVSNGNTGDGVNASANIGPIRWMAPEMLTSRNSGNGMFLSNCAGVQLDRCKSNGNAGVGIFLDESCVGGRIERCDSVGDGAGGIWVAGTGMLVMGNSTQVGAAGGFMIAPGNTSTPVLNAQQVTTNRVPDPNIEY